MWRQAHQPAEPAPPEVGIVFLRSLLRLVGRRVDRRFYFGHLLPGTQRGRAGRRAACSYVLLRNSFSGKWGSFAQQRPLALSSVRPPRNVTVRHQDALAYLRALPCPAHQCIYADPPYIFPGRSMNYYGTRGRATTWPFTRSCKTHKITEASKKLEMKKLYQVLIVCDDMADMPQLHKPNGALDTLFIRGRHMQIT